MKRILLLSAAFALVGSMSFAAVTPESLAADFLAQGYTSIEVTTGKTQIKVEAIGPTGKVEAIYDTASGALLKQETGAVEQGDDISAGVELRKRNRDFVKVKKVKPTHASDDHGSDDVADDDHGNKHDANDDHGQDDSGHDVNDDHGHDDSGHDKNDDHSESGHGSDD